MIVIHESSGMQGAKRGDGWAQLFQLSDTHQKSGNYKQVGTSSNDHLLIVRQSSETKAVHGYGRGRQAGLPRLIETLEKPGIYFGSLNPGNSLEFGVTTLKFVKDTKNRSTHIYIYIFFF